MERTRDIPVGCPLDEMEPVFVNGCYDLTRFEWIVVDALDQWGDAAFQDEPTLHRLYDGPHIYPLQTVQFLIEDGLTTPSPDTLPCCWAPLHTRPASHLRAAFQQMDNIWADLPFCNGDERKERKRT